MTQDQGGEFGFIKQQVERARATHRPKAPPPDTNWFTSLPLGTQLLIVAGVIIFILFSVH